MEVWPWKIPIALIEPRPDRHRHLARRRIRSGEDLVSDMSREHSALYAEHIARYRNRSPRAEGGGTCRHCCRTIESALTARRPRGRYVVGAANRSEEHTSEPTSLMRVPYAVFSFKKK